MCPLGHTCEAYGHPIGFTRPMSELGQIPSFGDVGSMSGLPETGHGGATYEYTPLV
jgi:hypothetical protein